MVVYSTVVSPLYFFTEKQTETINTGVDMAGKPATAIPTVIIIFLSFLLPTMTLVLLLGDNNERRV